MIKRQVQESGLRDTTKQDAIKVLECFRFIRVNLNALAQFIDHKQDFIPLLPRRDQINQCIRDHQGSSMHFNNYASGADACKNLLEIIENFETIFLNWQDSSHNLALTCLVAKFNWDEERGCLEARIAEPMSFVARYQSAGILSLEELIQLAQSLYFIGLNNYDFVMADEFFSPHYSKPLLINEVQQPLNRALVFEYMVVNLGYSELSDEVFSTELSTKRADLQAWFYKAFKYLIENAEPVILERTGTYKYLFKNRDAAENLNTWLQRCPLFQSSDNHDHCVLNELGFFGVRMTVKQMNQLNSSFLATLQRKPERSQKRSCQLHKRVEEPAERFLTALNSLTDSELNEQLSVVYPRSEPLFLLIACYQTKEVLLTVIQRASVTALEKAICLSPKHCCGPFEFIFKRHFNEVAIAVIQKVSAAALGRSLIIHNDKKNTAFIYAVYFAEQDIFNRIIDKLPVKQLERLLTLQNEAGTTAMNFICNYQSDDIVEFILGKISIECINKALILVNNRRDTLLHFTCYNPGKWAISLIQKASDTIIDKVLPYKNSNGQTALDYAFRQDSFVIFIHLIKRASVDTLHKLNFFHSLFCGYFEATILTTSFAVLTDRGLTNIMLELLLDWNALPRPTNLDPEAILKLLDARTNFVSFEQQKRLYFSRKIAIALRESQQNRTPLNVGLANKCSLGFQSKNLYENVVRFGLASWMDFFLLRKTSHLNNEAIQLHFLLDRMLDEQTLSLPPENIARTTLYEGNLLIKIFSGWQPDAKTKFIKQIQNPRERSALRIPSNEKTHSHKFYHLEGVIKPYPGKTGEAKPWHDSHAKKMSMTLLSPNKDTYPFQYQHQDAEMIGVIVRGSTDLTPGVYDPNQAKLKAMLLSDSGTFQRPWRGTEADVKTYAREVQGINFTSLSFFKHRVKNQTQTNEVLAEPPKGSIMGVVIARDNPEHRALAIDFQSTLQKEWGVNLPIMLYNPTTNLFIEDLTQYELRQKIQLLKEEQTILEEVPALSKTFLFNGNKIYNGRAYPKAVVRRLEKIRMELAKLEAQSAINYSC